MARLLQRSLAASALVVSLLTSGCADLPVVGPLFEAAKPILGVLDPVVGPIKGMLGMSEAPSPPPPPPRPRARRRPAEAPSQALPASGSTAAVPVESADAYFARMTDRNKEFDRLRTTGLMQLYAGETKMAIDSFEQAAKLRPDDPHIRELIELSKSPPRTEKPLSLDGLGGSSGGTFPTLPQGMIQ